MGAFKFVLAPEQQLWIHSSVMYILQQWGIKVSSFSCTTVILYE
jgi:hypothetical protein